jgi:hypothetical protein
LLTFVPYRPFHSFRLTNRLARLSRRTSCRMRARKNSSGNSRPSYSSSGQSGKARRRLRAAFCALYCPRDGREAYSGLYPQEGYPALDPKLSRLSLNMGGIDRLAPTEERILEWEAQCASPDFAFTQNLLTQAQEHFETKLLPAGERSEPYTAAEVKDFELEHQRRQEEALGILGRAARAAARYGISEQPSEVEIELDRAGIRELYGTYGITREQAREVVRSLSDLPGYGPEVESTAATSVLANSNRRFRR